MQKYALLDSAGKVRRVVAGKKPTDDALPVEYPDMSDTDKVENHVVQKPYREWDVKDDRVIVTYRVTPKDLDAEKERVIERIRDARKHKEHDGTFFTTSNGEKYRVRTDDKTQAKIVGAVRYLEEKQIDTSAKPKSRVASLFSRTSSTDDDSEKLTVSWERDPREWSEVDLEQLKYMSYAIGEHVQKCFTVQADLEQQVDQAKSIRELKKIDIKGAWPESAGLYNDRRQ